MKKLLKYNFKKYKNNKKYRDKEDDYNEFRQLICTYIENHIEDYYDFIVVGDHLHLDIIYEENFIFQKKREYLTEFIKKAKKIMNGQHILKLVQQVSYLIM